MDLQGVIKYSINAQKYKEEVSLWHVVTILLFSDSFVSLFFNSFTVTMNFPEILSDLLKESKLLLNLNFFRIIVTFRYQCMSLSVNEQISIQHRVSLDNYFDNISIRSHVAKLL